MTFLALFGHLANFVAPRLQADLTDAPPPSTASTDDFGDRPQLFVDGFAVVEDV